MWKILYYLSPFFKCNVSYLDQPFSLLVCWLMMLASLIFIGLELHLEGWMLISCDKLNGILVSVIRKRKYLSCCQGSFDQAIHPLNFQLALAHFQPRFLVTFWPSPCNISLLQAYMSFTFCRYTVYFLQYDYYIYGLLSAPAEWAAGSAFCNVHQMIVFSITPPLATFLPEKLIL